MGVKAVYRKVNDGMDDYCGHTGIAQWANDNGYKISIQTAWLLVS